MKIRTDFVTNSSSSSFIIEISVIDNKGKEYSVSIEPSDGGGNGNASLSCAAEEICNAKSIDSLIKLLSDSVVITQPVEKAEQCVKDAREDLKQLEKEMRKGAPSIELLSAVEIKRKWFARGEGAEGWLNELDEEGLLFLDGVNEFYDLVSQYRDSDNKGKREACLKLKAFMEDAKGFSIGWSSEGKKWPSNLLGTTPTVKLNWDRLSDDIEKAVEKIASGQIERGVDSAVETVKIDLNNKTIKSEAEYYLLPNSYF